MTFVKFINTISSCLVPAVSRELSTSLLTLLVPGSCALSLPSCSWRRGGRDRVLSPPSLAELQLPKSSSLVCAGLPDTRELQRNRKHPADRWLQPITLSPTKGPVASLARVAGRNRGMAPALAVPRSPPTPPGCSCSSGCGPGQRTGLLPTPTHSWPPSLSEDTSPSEPSGFTN